MIEAGASLRSGFLRSADAFPDRPALEVGDHRFTYRELRDRAAGIAATLARHGLDGGPELAAIFAYRSPTAFVGVLGALMSGRGYVPLNRTFPSDRTRSMLTRSGCRALIVDTKSAEQLEEVLRDAAPGMLLLFPDEADVGDHARRWPDHQVLGVDDLNPPDSWEAAPVSPDAIAYLLFTSGSTGIPKGVMVAHRNVLPFVESMVERYEVGETDRFSQTFDMTFDLSVFDMFVAWERGACLCCPTEKQLLQPGRFLRESGLTVWFSVPSMAVFMKRLGALKPDRYPDLRWSLFCGEPLPVEVAATWADAAPASILENLYGPTEVTIACLLYRWDPETSPAASEFGVVPIGDPYPGMTTRVVDETLAEVPEGGEGELLMCGPQVTPGYWKDPEKTAAAFVRPPGSEDLHYRTGDRVRAPRSGEPMVYLGRMDHQIKIHGHRVELGEVEAVLREESGIDAAIAVGWPRTVSGASGIVAFLESDDIDVREIRRRMADRLPEYMVPRQIRLISRMPLNANGKYDRPALVSGLEEDA